MSAGDRELLELAARAAGIDAEWHSQDDADYDAGHEGMYLKGLRSPDNSAYWNPLTRDGDALRLAIRLNLSVHQHQHGCGWVDVGRIKELTGLDACDATRRAIVRAAAEIGRALP